MGRLVGGWGGKKEEKNGFYCKTPSKAVCVFQIPAMCFRAIALETGSAFPSVYYSPTHY